MNARFPRGSTVYAKDGRTYIVEEATDGIVYCTTSNGAETEFAEDLLMTEAEWAARTKGRPKRELSYTRIKQARHFLPGAEKLDPTAAEQMLAKADRLSPGLIDFAAVTVAERILVEHKDDDLAAQLSIRKCRDIFDAAPAPVRARLLAELLGAKPDALVSAGALGGNLLKAMIDKGLEAHAAAYDEFQDRPRN
jgi:hypothetical protein